MDEIYNNFMQLSTGYVKKAAIVYTNFEKKFNYLYGKAMHMCTAVTIALYSR